MSTLNIEKGIIGNKNSKDETENTIERKIFNNKVKPTFFENTLYRNCEFKSIEFNNIEFKGVFFENCIFDKCVFKNSKSDLKKFLCFDRCTLIFVSFIWCGFSGVTIFNSYIYAVTFEDTVLVASILYRNCYDSLEFKNDCNLWHAAIIDSLDKFDISFLNHYAYTKLNSTTTISDFNYEDSQHELIVEEDNILKKYEIVSNTFLNIANQYAKNNLMEHYGDFFYKSKLEYHKTLKCPSRKWLFSFVSKWSCGYGERATRSLLISLGFIIVFALLYMVCGVDIGEVEVYYYPTIKNSMSISEVIRTIGTYIHFSIVTFTTVGYGNIVPIGFSKVLSSLEMLLGVLLTTIYTATLIRKMTR